jgi:hypothetical protein
VSTIYFTNNLPYAQALENGHSNQAPGGMVGLTALMLRNISGGNERGTQWPVISQCE